MHIRILGSAAGGGYPQWNCNHPNSRRARDKPDLNAPPRTQSSIAISQDGKRWFLFNASPDLRQQINDNDILHPQEALRESPIQGVVLTNADVDHIAGLLNLRESQPLNLYGTRKVLDVLHANSVFNVLNPDFVSRIQINLNQPFKPNYAGGRASDITIIPFAVPGKVALWLEQKDVPVKTDAIGEDTIALEVQDGNQKTLFFYIPGCAQLTDTLKARLGGAPLVLFDGTLFTDNEMITSKTGIKTGKRMGHISVSGEDGTLAGFKDLDVARKLFIHINTTNPILVADSSERKTVEAEGWEVTYDGMAIEL